MLYLCVRSLNGGTNSQRYGAIKDEERGCMSPARKRKLLIEQYGKLFSIPEINQDVCAYCGQKKSGMDHVPSINSIDKLGIDFFKKRNIKFILIPCCRDCNSLLGARLLHTYHERLNFVIKRLSKSICENNKKRHMLATSNLHLNFI